MLPVEFLRSVLPNEGHYILWGKHAKRGSAQKCFKNVEDLLDFATAKNSQGWDVYFALSSFKDPQADKPRGHDNAQAVKAFWLDIDCGPSKPYKNQIEGYKALQAFGKAVELPKPSIVSSGYGLHVYWLLTSSIKPEQWVQIASRFKELAAAHGLLADPSRTADLSSILRIPGTHNHKNGNLKKVEFKIQGEIISPVRFVGILKKAREIQGIKSNKTPSSKLTEKLQSNLQEHYPDTKAIGRHVISHCAQMKYIWERGGDVPEPLWYRGLQAARFFDDPEKWYFELTTGYDGWSEEELRRKVSQLESGNIGPTLCETFEAERSGGCDGCPYRGKIQTPVRISTTVTSAEPPRRDKPPEIEQKLSSKVDKNFIPNPPFPYVRVADKGLFIQEEDATAEGEPTISHRMFYRYDFYPVELCYDYITKEKITRWMHVHPHDGCEELEFPAALMHDKRNMLIALAKQGIFLRSEKDKNAMVSYMLGYLEELTRLKASSKLHAQQGWAGNDLDQFVIGDRIVTKAGIDDISVGPSVSAVTCRLTKMGSYETWKKAVSAYEREEYVAHAFGFMTAFGAPLMRFSPYDGAIVSMVGATASGKTTVLQAINSVWGEPKNWIIKEDTQNARLSKVGTMNSLPVTFDEITKIHPDELSSFCYQVSNGRAKDRLNAAAQFKENFNSWRTMMAVTTNVSLVSKLMSNGDTDGNAEAHRVFEFYLTNQNLMTPDEAYRQFSPLLENYGHAGEIYARFLVDHRHQLKAAVEKQFQEFTQEAECTVKERFWAWCIACNIVGGRIAKSLGIHNIDMRRVFDWAVNQVKSTREVVHNTYKTPEDVLTDYFNANVGNTLCMLGDTPGQMYRDQNAVQPHNRVNTRIERERHRAFIDASEFRRFCTKEAQQDYKLVSDELYKLGVFLPGTVKKILTEDTILASGRSTCHLVMLDHERMIGRKLEAVSISKEKTKNESRNRQI